jgi:hypothetical protein
LPWSPYQILGLAFLLFIFSGFCMAIAPQFPGFHPFFTFGVVAVDIGILFVLLLQPSFELKGSLSFLINGLFLLGIIS